MAIRVTCESCDHEFRTRDENAGRKVRCPECAKPVAVRRTKGDKSKKSGGPNVVIMASVAGVLVVAGIIVAALLFMGGGNADGNAPAPVVASPPGVAGPANASGMPSTSPMPVVTAGNTVPAGPPAAPKIVPASATATPINPLPATSVPAATVPPGTLVASTPNAAGQRPADMSLADLIEKFDPSVVRIDIETEEGGGNGSGFVVDKTGIIVTNYHVIAGARRAIVNFKDGSKTPVLGFLKIDTKRDVAIIKVEHPADKLFPVKLAPTLPRKGEKVVAFGAPLGLSWTATDGVISAFRTTDELAKLGIGGIDGDWIQTSTPISPGNSGGPLMTFNGEVIGMNTMQLTIGQNLNFAVQAKEIDLVLQQAMTPGTQLVALSPATAPKTAKIQKPVVVDVSKSERGKKLMGKLKEVSLIVLAGNLDPTRRITLVVRDKAIETAKKLGLLVRDGDESDNELMLVTLEFRENANSKAGAAELHMSMVVFFRDRTDDGKLEICKIWEQEERIGSFPIRAFATGEMPKLVIDKLGTFFGKFKVAFNAAHMEADKAEKATKSATEKSKSSK